MLTHAPTWSCFERTCMFIRLLFPLLRDMTKLEVRSLASMCSNILNTSPLLASRHVCPFTHYRILVFPWLSHNASAQTKLETAIPSGPEVNISSSWRRKSQSRAIVVTRHIIWCTQNSPLLPPSDGQVSLRTKVHLPAWSNSILSWSKELRIWYKNMIWLITLIRWNL